MFTTLTSSLSMILQHILALGVFSSYFLMIIFLLGLISKDIYAYKTSSGASKSKLLLFFALTLISFAHTWFYMFKYMAWSFANYEQSLQSVRVEDLLHRVASWLYDTSLFEEAWSIVCFHPLNWWWSEQLCTLTTGVWTAFIAIEGKRYNIKHLWAYMLMGQIVAISVASNLFYLSLVLAQLSPRNEGTYNLRANAKLWTCVLLSLASVAISSSTSQRSFLPNLLIMHALLFVPLVGPDSTSPEQSPASYSMDIRSLFRLVQLAAACIHLRTVLAAIKFLKQSSSISSLPIASVAWDILHSNPAQSSIGWDVVWTSISFIVWVLVKPGRRMERSRFTSVIYLLLATPVSSIGVTAPYVLRPIAQPPNLAGEKLE